MSLLWVVPSKFGGHWINSEYLAEHDKYSLHQGSFVLRLCVLLTFILRCLCYNHCDAGHCLSYTFSASVLCQDFRNSFQPK